MNLYLVRVLWDRNGTKYPMADSVRVRASSVRAAASKALAPQYKRLRKGWREPAGASFTLSITNLGEKEGEE